MAYFQSMELMPYLLPLELVTCTGVCLITSLLL